MRNPFEFVETYYFKKYLVDLQDNKRPAFLLRSFIKNKLHYLGKRWIVSDLDPIETHALPLKKYYMRPFEDMEFDLYQLYTYVQNMRVNLEHFINFQPKLVEDSRTLQYETSGITLDPSFTFIMPRIKESIKGKPSSITLVPIVDTGYKYNYGKRFGFIDDLFSDNGLYPDTLDVAANYISIIGNNAYNFYFESMAFLGDTSLYKLDTNIKDLPSRFGLAIISDFETETEINTINIKYIKLSAKMPVVEQVQYLTDTGLQKIDDKYISILGTTKENLTISFPMISTKRIIITLADNSPEFIGTDLLRFKILNKSDNMLISTLFYSLDTLFDFYKDLVKGFTEEGATLDLIYQYFYNNFDILLGIAINKIKLKLQLDYGDNVIIYYDGVQVIKDTDGLFSRLSIGVNNLSFYYNKYEDEGELLTTAFKYTDKVDDIIQAIDFGNLQLFVVLDNGNEYPINNGEALSFNDPYNINSPFIGHMPKNYRIKVWFKEENFLIGVNDAW